MSGWWNDYKIIGCQPVDYSYNEKPMRVYLNKLYF